MLIELKKSHLVKQVNMLLKVYELGKNGNKFDRKMAAELVAFAYNQEYWNELTAMLLSEMMETN